MMQFTEAICFRLANVKRDVGELHPESIPPALDKDRMTTTALEADYISRPGLEAKSKHSLIQPRITSIVLSIARKERGSLKSSNTAIGKRALLKVPVTSIGTRDDFEQLSKLIVCK